MYRYEMYSIEIILTKMHPIGKYPSGKHPSRKRVASGKNIPLDLVEINNLITFFDILYHSKGNDKT